tara:strand:- start:467 stop:1273 length:807 start_codon:yes stop_codon:yes gene_type:complete
MSIPAQMLAYHVPGKDVDISDLVAQTATVRLPLVKRPETIVIMAGGIGQRMMPLTKDTPKPMLLLNGQPILEHILGQMILQGFHRFVFSIRHLGSKIRDYFDDGSKWGVTIEYIVEPHRLGTAGSLAYLQRTDDLPLIVANADLITDLDYRKVLECHADDVQVTMCTRQAEFQVPYGVVDAEGDQVTKVTEKPTQSVTISAGMYVVSSEFLSFIEKGEHVDMPDLIERAIARGAKVRSMPIYDRWVDVGRRINYERVRESLGEGAVIS